MVRWHAFARRKRTATLIVSNVPMAGRVPMLINAADLQHPHHLLQMDPA